MTTVRDLVADLLDDDSPGKESKFAPIRPAFAPSPSLAAQGESPNSPFSPGQPVQVHSPPPLTGEDLETISEAIEERAAIMEFDGGLSRAEAERQARDAMRVYYALADGNTAQPPRWRVMLLPGVDSLGEARKAAEWRFPGWVLAIHGPGVAPF